MPGPRIEANLYSANLFPDPCVPETPHKRTICRLGRHIVTSPGTRAWMVVVNRALALCLIWATAILGLWRQRVEATLQEGAVRLRASSRPP